MVPQSVAKPGLHETLFGHQFGAHELASSFSKQVIEARQEAFEAERGKEAIRNVVEYFGKW